MLRNKILLFNACACLLLIVFLASGCSLFGLWEEPDADAKQLWTYIQKRKPYIEYPFIPGKNGLHKGQEPHGAWLQTFVNATALESIEDKKAPLEPGSLIVMENYSEEKELRELTVMYKVEGYNSKAGDWYWATYDINGEPLREGRAKVCISCHSEMVDNDYIFSGKIK